MRLKLYEYLKKLDRRILYYDRFLPTYTSSKHPNESRTSNFLRDMTNKLEDYGRGSFIEAFVSGGLMPYEILRVRGSYPWTDAIIKNL